MSTEYTSWNEVKAKGQALDPRSETDRAAGKAAAQERREPYVRGHQLSEMRKIVGLTQAQLAKVLDIEHGTISNQRGSSREMVLDLRRDRS